MEGWLEAEEVWRGAGRRISQLGVVAWGVMAELGDGMRRRKAGEGERWEKMEGGRQERG